MFFKRKNTKATPPREVGVTSEPASYEYVLSLSKDESTSDAPENHFAGLSTELRISKAVFYESKGVLEVNGWCLTPEPEYDLFLEVSGTNIATQISSVSEERLDVFRDHPQYGDKRSGWKIKLTVESLPDRASVLAIYASDERSCRFDKRITRVDPDPAAIKESFRMKESFQIQKCTHSPLRSLCLVSGVITTERDDLTFEATQSDGVRVRNLHKWIASPNDKGQRTVKLSFAATGVRDKEEITISEVGNPEATASAPVTIANDSPRRVTATTPSVRHDVVPVENTLVLDELLALKRQLSAFPKRSKKAGEICFFPAFDDIVTLSDHYHRASWYLTGAGSSISKVTLAGPGSKSDITPPPSYFGSRSLDAETLELTAPGNEYVEALLRAKTILVWRPLPPGLRSYLAQVLGKPDMITVATNDPAAVEYGNYCRAPWMLLPETEKATLLQESQDRFRKALRKQSDAGKTCSAVFGTGPSIDRAFEFDFGNCMTVACNSIVANTALLDHINPAFICAGDAVSHFGVSQYAETFRADLIRTVTERDIYLFTSAMMGYLLIQKHPEIRDRVILCEQKYNGLNVDLDTIWALPRFDSTLNIHMLPIAATFSDTIYMLGLDGRDPNPEANEDFWAHSKSAQYHDLVDSGHLAHPSFAINRTQATEGRYLASVEESFMAGECRQKSFYTLADSFTPAVHARPAPPHCFEPAASAKKSRKLRAVQNETIDTTAMGKRALIVTQITRRYFSGGRYHGTMMAEALAGFCNEVVVWANNMPPWSDALAYCPDHAKVRYWIDEHLQPPEGDFDYVIVLPDGAQNPAMYLKAYEKAKNCNAKTIFLNFESPNWFNALSPAPKKLTLSDNWFAAACFSDIILSSADTAVPFAETFYQTLHHRPVFAVAPPAINSGMADLVKQDPPPREKQIVLISRFKNASAHKNIDAIFDLVTPEMEGYTLALIAGTSELPDEEAVATFRDKLKAKGMGLKLLYMISDREKFEEIARSELMIFPSLFEGFGYPPVEAGYMGTPCVAYDLPVLQEFSNDHAYFVPWNDTEALRGKISELLRQPFDARLRTKRPKVLKTATLTSFRDRLHALLEHDEAPHAAQAFSPETFELARKVYLDGCHTDRLEGSDLLGREALQEVAKRYTHYSQVLQQVFDQFQARFGPKT